MAVVSFDVPELSGPPAQRYADLADVAAALVAGEPDLIANAANVSSLVFHSLPQLNWVGFYFYDGTELFVGPFQGNPACVRIPLARGVCGAAARTGVTHRVDDVHAVADHIACDAASRSELVVPLIVDDGLIGVFDLDSPVTARFDDDDQAGLERIAAIVVEASDVSGARGYPANSGSAAAETSRPFRGSPRRTITVGDDVSRRRSEACCGQEEEQVEEGAGRRERGDKEKGAEEHGTR